MVAEADHFLALALFRFAVGLPMIFPRRFGHG
jgi:hypothetical protein